MSKRLNMKWAIKVLRAKYFVVLTESESAIVLEGVDPQSMYDPLMLRAQADSIKEFQSNLADLLKVHQDRIDELSKEGDVTGKRKKAKQKAKNYQVSDGI